jgi:hypothetical protein
MTLRHLVAAAVTLLLGSLLDRAAAQVTVGYSSITSAVGAAISDSSYRQRLTDQYAITGVNVEPIDGGDVFDRNTIWKTNDSAMPWSLTIRDDSLKADVNKETSQSQLVQAGRSESVYSVISGPLYGTVQRYTLSPFAPVQLPAIIPVSTTVFSE